MSDSHPLLLANARRLFDLGIGSEVGKRLKQDRWSFEAYLRTLPSPCTQCLAVAEASAEGPATDIFQYFLVEPRAGLVVSCTHGSIVFYGSDETLAPFDTRHAVPNGSYWALLNPGRGNRKKRLPACRTAFARKRGILSARAMDGVYAHIHYPGIATESSGDSNGHALDMPGSVCAMVPGSCASLGIWDGQARLGWWQYHKYGGAFLVECKHLAR